MGYGVWGACTPSLPINRGVVRSGGLSGAGEQGTKAPCPRPSLPMAGNGRVEAVRSAPLAGS